MSKQLIITVGVPGAGKSTLLAGSAIPVVSSDEVRVQLTGDRARQDQNELVWDTVHDLLRMRLRSGSVILDATNLMPAHRAPLLAIAREAGAQPVAWRLTTSLREAQDRNQRRQCPVPDAVIKTMHRTYRVHCSFQALRDEGWTVMNVDPQENAA